MTKILQTIEHDTAIIQIEIQHDFNVDGALKRLQIPIIQQCDLVMYSIKCEVKTSALKCIILYCDNTPVSKSASLLDNNQIVMRESQFGKISEVTIEEIELIRRGKTRNSKLRERLRERREWINLEKSQRLIFECSGGGGKWYGSNEN